MTSADRPRPDDSLLGGKSKSAQSTRTRNAVINRGRRWDFLTGGGRGQPGNPSANVEIGKNSEWRVIGLEQRDRARRSAADWTLERGVPTGK
eukprot:COSAG02_NODE_7215_length_3113_cov_19.920703_2_plen_92_part_00